MDLKSVKAWYQILPTRILPEIEEWQRRPLSSVYPIVFIDAIHYSVRDNGVIRKLAAYTILGINEERSTHDSNRRE